MNALRRKLLVLLVALCAVPLAFAADKPAAPVATPNPVVVIKTNMGTIKAELFLDRAPVTVNNFMEYVDAKHYDGTIFHRVINNFMVQGGGYDAQMREKSTRAPIKNEAANGLKNTVGTLAMARTSDPNSATAQFFINVKDNMFLDFKDPSSSGIGYCVFGKVIEGMDTVNMIKTVATGSHSSGMRDVPKAPVIIESIRRDQPAKK